MATPISRYLADWLSTKPGFIREATPEACWDRAYVMSRIGSHDVPLEVFREELQRAGYDVRPRQGFGDDSGTHHVLLLPEKQAGSRS